MSDPITSASNPQIKDLVRLRDRRHRDRTGTFVVEGYRSILRAAEGGLVFERLYVSPGLFLGSNEAQLIERIAGTGTPVIEVAVEPFRKAAYRDRPEGLLAVARQFATSIEALQPGADPLLFVVEAIEKPGNLGTMLRTADAAGCDAVIVCDPTTDPFNPNVVRASTGMLFVVPLAVASTDETIEWLHRHRIATFATTPATETLHTDADLTGAVAIVVGTEQYGLSDTWLERADHRIRIPMAGAADSLNAAMAAGITLFEAVRQRHAGRLSDSNSGGIEKSHG
ncbi:MAG: RNA methyltransferase [Acidimicrobiia bacterium]|nr:RNA methyltransferase [Acidimicrobiia bacterium]